MGPERSVHPGNLQLVLPDLPRDEWLPDACPFRRQGARLKPGGDIVTLEEQDRALWDLPEIAEARLLLRAALSRHLPGRYQLQAAIAACHADAPSAAATDWIQIVGLYDLLLEVLPTPVARLNRGRTNRADQAMRAHRKLAFRSIGGSTDAASPCGSSASVSRIASLRA